MKSSKLLGKFGEDKAAEFIQKQGFKILERNYRNYIGEIDIIALDKNTYCFIEVKTRQGKDFGFPEESVNQKKQLKISQAAQLYFEDKGIYDKEGRFDVVSIFLGPDGTNQIEIIKDAFDLL